MHRFLDQLFCFSNVLSGEEAERLRPYRYNVYIDPDNNLKDSHGLLLKTGTSPLFRMNSLPQQGSTETTHFPAYHPRRPQPRSRGQGIGPIESARLKGRFTKAVACEKVA